MRLLSFMLMALTALSLAAQAPASPKPLKVAIAGLVHTHVHWILGRVDDGDLELVGVFEPNRELAIRYLDQYNLSHDLLYNALEPMLEEARPEAVTAFNTILGHLEVVEACAPRGIHVMVEKPLAVSLKQAQQMAKLARKHRIHLLTNYETTWYGSNLYAKQSLDDGKLGPVRKIVVHDGHEGPEEIGVNREFLEWLIDPVQNGAGALFDFGCYGANLSTWIMQGERPLSVMALTQTVKPEKYPLVDDEATILLEYPSAQAVIQASWNWPFNRKDMHVYGKTGYVKTIDGTNYQMRMGGETAETPGKADALPQPIHDPFAYLAAVVRGDQSPEGSLSSLENNLVVMEILEAARKSAKSGKKVRIR